MYSARHHFRATTSLTTALFFTFSSVAAYANPIDGTVIAGQATISSAGNTLSVHQATDKAVIDWRGFDIGAGEHTQFIQPSSNSIALNRINSTSASQIDGRLSANGNVIIVNQNGIVFGAGSRVDVNGLVATTADTDSNAFMAGGPIHFNKPGNPAAAIRNDGTITAAQAGLVGLVAPSVTNNGVITARLGRVQLASGDTATVDLYGDGLMEIGMSENVTSQLISNNGTIRADGGVIALTAASGKDILNNLVTNTGIVSAATVGESQGVITIGAATAQNGMGGTISNTGTITASGTKGGTVQLKANNIAQQGTIRADGTTGNGGKVQLAFDHAYIDSEAAITSANSAGAKGGDVHVNGTTQASSLFASGTYQATGAQGGKVTFEAGDSVRLYAAKADVSGKTAGGEIRVGGGARGLDGTMRNAKTTVVNPSTVLKANATEQGNGGAITVWSDTASTFMGTAEAKGGLLGGNGGLIELSSANTLNIGKYAITDASATAGKAGQLLLDPKNITISNGGATSGLSYFELVDPHANGTLFGSDTTTLANGNIVVTDAQDNFNGTDAGAVYLFNGATGGLISTFLGNAGDRIGQSGIIKLATDNFLIQSTNWNNGAITAAGFVAFASGVTGLNGVVSAVNALVGTTANDQIGNVITALANGNYLVSSSFWSNGSALQAGAVTFGNGTTGISGGISAANSLVGSHSNDAIGSEGITLLTNGNYLVSSSGWSSDTQAYVGAVTFGNGTTGVKGTVSSLNSLVGSQAYDNVGISGITVLDNGNYVVSSTYWSNGLAEMAGAVTFGNGITGVSGEVNASNSLVGTHAYDYVGGSGITKLSNGNYVVNSSSWSSDTTSQTGAITLGNATTGISGAVSALNSLVGSAIGDTVGSSGITEIGNSNFLVRSLNWAGSYGAVTFVNGSTGLTGEVSASNSLVGSHPGDAIGSGGITVLSNGNYVVNSRNWSSDLLSGLGAVTWGDGNAGVSGVVDHTNSLVGSQAMDRVGSGGITALENGNYLIVSPNWANGSAANAGAVTFAHGTYPSVSGQITSANSLVGTRNGDAVGSDGISILKNGNYLVKSFSWANLGPNHFGALTFGDGLTGVSGDVSALNSLVGGDGTNYLSNATFQFHYLDNGSYLAVNSNWSSPTHLNVGAVVYGNGTTGVSGSISSANALIGSHDYDTVGSGGVTLLRNGNYVVVTPTWSSDTHSYVGAVTFGDASTGVVGEVSALNSLVGSHDFDQIGTGGVTALTNGNYVVNTPSWSDGINSSLGAVTWGSGTSGVMGEVTALNSLIGTHAYDNVGGGGITALSNGNYVVNSYDWSSDTHAYIGAITWGNGTTGVTGEVSALNSLIGSQDYDAIGINGITALSNGSYLIVNPYWSSATLLYAGAVTFGNGTTGVTGEVSALNSLVGSQAYDLVGSDGVTLLANGNYLVNSGRWSSGSATGDFGAVTLGSGNSGVRGEISAANSIIGTVSPSAANASDTVTPTGSDRVLLNMTASGKLYSIARDLLTEGISFTAAGAGTDVTLAPSFITKTLNAGTDVTLSANNDIRILNDIIANNPSGNGGALTLNAGRSIFIHANITTDNGDLSLFGNLGAGSGTIDAYRAPGIASITMAPGTTINAGTGSVYMLLDSGLGNTYHAGGDITLSSIFANSIFAQNLNTTGDIVLNGALHAQAGSGTGITLASLRNFINNNGANALQTAAGSRFLVYSTTPSNNRLNNITNLSSIYGCTYGNSCVGVPATGNVMVYSGYPAPPVSTPAVSPLIIPVTVQIMSQRPTAMTGTLSAASPNAAPSWSYHSDTATAPATMADGTAASATNDNGSKTKQKKQSALTKLSSNTADWVIDTNKMLQVTPLLAEIFRIKPSDIEF